MSKKTQENQENQVAQETQGTETSPDSQSNQDNQVIQGTETSPDSQSNQDNQVTQGTETSPDSQSNQATQVTQGTETSPDSQSNQATQETQETETSQDSQSNQATQETGTSKKTQGNQNKQKKKEPGQGGEIGSVDSLLKDMQGEKQESKTRAEKDKSENQGFRETGTENKTVTSSKQAQKVSASVLCQALDTLTTIIIDVFAPEIDGSDYSLSNKELKANEELLAEAFVLNDFAPDPNILIFLAIGQSHGKQVYKAIKDSKQGGSGSGKVKKMSSATGNSSGSGKKKGPGRPRKYPKN